MANPAHWRSEIDLGIYAPPLLDQPDRQKAISETLERLQERVEFINERLKWCRDRKLELPALTFERTAVMLEAEIQWLKNTFKRLGSALPNFHMKIGKIMNIASHRNLICFNSINLL
ncbi:MAG: hypothetical protein IPJ71_04010 [Bdellovibrionales bacterium]|nr:hypothetical protein [Bdellovibrionales bacterium]